ncbi:class I adenylate-forming enzyme family protein [Pseudonocardia kongjuensis]
MRYIDLFDRGAEFHPDRDVVRFQGRSWSFAQMQELTHRVAGGLVREGLQAAEAVAVLSPNHPYGVACQYGIVRAGLPYVPVNARNSRFDNAAVLEQLRVRFLFFHSSLAEHAEHLIATVPTLRGGVCLDAPAGERPGLDGWMPEAGSPDDSGYFPTGRDDVVALASTSGTSGRPKGVMLTNGNFECMAASYQSLMHYDVPPVTVMAAPATHAAGYMAGTLLPQGGTMVLLETPDPVAIMEAIQEHRATTIFMPPTLIYTLLAHPKVRDYDYSSLRYLIYGGAPIATAKLVEALDVFGPVLAHHYAQTEAAVVIAFMSPAEHVEARDDPRLTDRLRSSGRPGPFTRVAVMDDDGRLLGPGESGEIVCRSSMVMKGYVDDPEETARVGEFGWHHTGDIGVRDEHGYVHVVDRKKDMIISGGFNIYPAEVEQVVLQTATVQDCAVVGVPDDKWGEAVCAVLQLKPGMILDEPAELRRWRELLGGVKCPKRIEIWPELPRNGAGKVLKRSIRDQFWEGRARAI